MNKEPEVVAKKARLLPGFEEILFMAVLAGVMLISPRMLNQDGDTGRHIAIGRFMLSEATIPRLDVFSHTMSGQPLTPHEWVAQILFGFMDRLLGLGGVAWLAAVLLAATFLLTFQRAREGSRMPLISLGLTLLGLAAASIHFLLRPHLFTLLFCAVWMLLMERVRLEKRLPLWVPAVVMLIWVNTHGAFISGLVIWAAYAGEFFWEALKKKTMDLPPRLTRALLIGGVSLLVSLMNPAGVKLWTTTFNFLGSRYLVGHTQEYLPVNIHQPEAVPFLLMVALSIFLLAIKPVKTPLSHALLLAGWTVMAFYSARNIPIYAVVAVPILAGTASAVIEPRARWQQIEARFLIIGRVSKSSLWVWLSTAALLLLLTFSPSVRDHPRYDAEKFPLAAVEWIEANPQTGNMFNYFPWGGYLLYRLYPQYQVFIDGQTDFYGEAMTREYEAVITVQQNWQKILEKYQVAWALLPAAQPAAQAMTAAGWQEIYRDGTAVILRK